MSSDPDFLMMIEEIHRFVKSSDRVVRQREGYPVYKRYIGVCPVEAYTGDSGYTHGIHCPDLIHAYSYNGESHVEEDQKESLISLYNLMKEGLT